MTAGLPRSRTGATARTPSPSPGPSFRKIAAAQGFVSGEVNDSNAQLRIRCSRRARRSRCDRTGRKPGTIRPEPVFIDHADGARADGSAGAQALHVLRESAFRGRPRAVPPAHGIFRNARGSRGMAERRARDLSGRLGGRGPGTQAARARRRCCCRPGATRRRPTAAEGAPRRPRRILSHPRLRLRRRCPIRFPCCCRSCRLPRACRLLRSRRHPRRASRPRPVPGRRLRRRRQLLPLPPQRLHAPPWQRARPHRLPAGAARAAPAAPLAVAPAKAPQPPAPAPMALSLARQPAPAPAAAAAAAPQPAKAAASGVFGDSNVREVLKALGDASATGETRLMRAPPPPRAAAPAPAKESLSDTQVLKLLEVRRPEGSEPQAAGAGAGARRHPAAEAR